MPESIEIVSGRTGEQCRESGPYRSSGQARAVVFVKAGDAFPSDVDGSETVWTLLTEDDDQ